MLHQRTDVLRVLLHAACNLQRHTIHWSFADWRRDYLACAELRAEARERVAAI